MAVQLDGATRVYFIVGDPIAQVQSPAGMTQAFAERGLNAVCVPAHVVAADLADWLVGVSKARNLDGILVTVPHKFASAALCTTLSERGRFLGTVNCMRRNAEGSWHGDMCDGLAMVAAIQARGCKLGGARALLVGAGGAGSAIGQALLSAGVAELAVHDADTARRDTLIARLALLKVAPVRVGSADPSGFDVVVNASPAGMRAEDPLPVDTDRLAAQTYCACAITKPAVSPWIAAARLRGCPTVTGIDMFTQVRELMTGFLLGD